MENTLPKFSKAAFGFLIAALLIGVSYSACSNKAPVPTAPPAAITSPSALAPALKPPIRAVVFDDKTGSWRQTKAEPTKIEDLEIVIEALKKVGGELAYALIKDESNRGLIRLLINVPPQPPQKPEPPQRFETGNLYDRERQRERANKEYDSNLKGYESMLKEFGDKRALWEQETNSKIEKFKADVTPLLHSAADATATDVMGALERARTYLDEPDDFWTQHPRLFALLASDCADNVDKPLTQFKPDMKLLVANGLATANSLTYLNPKLFESSRSALAWIAKHASD